MLQIKAVILKQQTTLPNRSTDDNEIRERLKQMLPTFAILASVLCYNNFLPWALLLHNTTALICKYTRHSGTAKIQQKFNKYKPTSTLKKLVTPRYLHLEFFKSGKVSKPLAPVASNYKTWWKN